MNRNGLILLVVVVAVAVVLSNAGLRCPGDPAGDHYPIRGAGG